MSDNLDQRRYGKKRKLNLIENLNPNQTQNPIEVADPSNIELLSDIFKMNVDCFEEVFEYLSTADLLALRCISKRFKMLVEHYIRSNCQGLGKFRLNEQSFDLFRQMDAGTISLINELEVLVTHDFDGTQFSSIEQILENVQKITITEWNTDPNFYGIFLKYCKNVKCLSIRREEEHFSYITINNDWLNHHYPSLECIRLDFLLQDEIELLKGFFHLNPKIKALSIKTKFLNKIGLDLVAAGIKFNRLYVGGDREINDNCIDLLKRLYDQRFYKRLCLYSDNGVLGDNNLPTSIGLEVLKGDVNIENQALPCLKELYIYGVACRCHENVENVERITSWTIYYNGIMEFIGFFPKLKHFRVKNIVDTEQFNLNAMNKERKKLAGACKTTIYVPENDFLLTKWSTNTSIGLIELKRVQACDWDQLFENDCSTKGT